MEKKWFADCKHKVVITSYYEFVQKFRNDYCEALKKSPGPGSKRINKLLSKHSRQPKDYNEALEYAPEINEVLNIIFGEIDKKAENKLIKKSLIMIDELMPEANGLTQLNFSQWAKFENIDFIWSFRPGSNSKEGNGGEMTKEANQHFQSLHRIHRNSENVLRFAKWYIADEVLPVARKLGSNEPIKISEENLERPLPKGDEKYPQGMVHWIPFSEGEEAETSKQLANVQLKQCLLNIGNSASAAFTFIERQFDAESMISSELRKLPNLKGVYVVTSFEGSEDDVIVYVGPLYHLSQAVITRARKHLILFTPPIELMVTKVWQNHNKFYLDIFKKKEKKMVKKLEEACKTKQFVCKVT